LINNRQAGRRNRGRNNPRPNGGGNRGGGDNGNRIDSRARGNAAQLLEKYKNMARDAQMAGDRVNMEYYLQFADHYFRVLADNRARQEEQQQRTRRPGESFEDEAEDFDGVDDGDEFRIDAPQQRQPRERQPERQYERQPERGGQERRPERSPDRQGDGQQDRASDGWGEQRAEPRGERRDRPRRDPRIAPVERVEAAPVAAQEPEAPVTPSVEEAPVEQPRRRGRPRKVPIVDSAPAGLDAAVLPPSIARSDNDGGTEAEAAPRKRTRRARPAAEAAE